MKQKTPAPDPDFDWLLKARSEIQQTLLDLRKFGTTHRDALIPQGDTVSGALFALLVGTAFSLWRAAFLSDIERSWPELIDKANDLLKTLLITNAVPFSTDRDVRNWMMGYYLNNARFRIADACEKLGGMPDADAFRRFAEIHPHGIIDLDRTPTEIWDILLGALCELFNSLKLRMAVPSNGVSSV
jgi:hypothetical protein